MVSGVPVQWCDQPTNGVIYIKLAFDASKLPEELQVRLGIKHVLSVNLPVDVWNTCG